MNPEREFLLTAFSHFLDQNPNKAKENAMDMCEKYLIQQEKTTRLSEHCKLLEERNEEMLVDYQILRIELENEQQKNLSTKKRSVKHSSIGLPDFLSNAPHRYFQS